MGVKINRSACLYCGACVGVCPVSALSLDEIRIVANNQKCIECGFCEKTCPVGAIKVHKGYKGDA